MHFRRFVGIFVLSAVAFLASAAEAAPREEPRDAKTRIIKILKKLGLVPSTLEDSVVPPKP